MILNLAYSCKFLVADAYSILEDGKCNSCSGDSEEGKKNFTDISNNQNHSITIKEKCRTCNVLPLCSGGCEVQNQMGFQNCVCEKYYLDDILRHYIDNYVS